jgi:hypothetical protein
MNYNALRPQTAWVGRGGRAGDLNSASLGTWASAARLRKRHILVTCLGARYA